MARNGYRNLIIITLVLAFGISACASGNRKNLKRLKYNKEKELRETWKDYIVYKRYRDPRSWQRGVVAFVYKLKDEKTILLDKRWIEVTSEDIKAESILFSSAISAEIRGYNEELYGYLIYRNRDLASVKIIDEQTVKLSYHYQQTYSN
jgi:intein/homing endonuclease